MAAQEQVFRVTTYELVAGEFSGLTFKLYLEQALSTNYFVMLHPSVAASAAIQHATSMVAVTADPYGTGDLAVSNASYLLLERLNNVSGDWIGTITVVECIADEDSAGFRLLDVVRTTCADFASTGTQNTTDTIATPWSDISQIMLAGGVFGGGCLSSAATGANDIPSGGASIYPSGTNTINIDRVAVLTTTVEEADFVTYVVEWGHEWTVQKVTVSGTNGGADIDATGEYDNTTLVSTVVGNPTPVKSANTWAYLPGGGTGSDEGIGDGWPGNVPTIGDGVTELATETVASLGSQFNDAKSATIYVMSHHGLVVDRVFKASGNSGDTSVALTVAAPTIAEDYGTTFAGVARTVGVRIADHRGSAFSTGSNYAQGSWGNRFTASTTMTVTRGWSGSTWAAWVQSVDLGGITIDTGKDKVFRVTTYELENTTAQFNDGQSTYDLTLIENLVENYFVMIRGSTDDSLINPNDSAVSVSQDPFGTGGLTVSSAANVIRLSRLDTDNVWNGTITVVECLRSFDSHGFRLIDVTKPILAAYSGTETQMVIATAAAQWGDLSRVTCFTGERGGGSSTAGATATEWPSLGVAAFAKDMDQIVLLRTPGASSTLAVGGAIVYVVEWGSAWDVQSAIVTARSDNTYQINVPIDHAVNPDTTWLWASNTTFGETPDTDWGGVIWHLGDGSAQGASEDVISFALNTAEGIVSVVYLLSHPDIAVDWRSQASTASADLDITVDDAQAGEAYGALSSVEYTSGHRFALLYNAATASTAGEQSGSAVRTRHTAIDEVSALRAVATGNWYGWLQSVDLSGVQVQTADLDLDNALTPGPVQYLILQDPHWKQFANVVSATSEGGMFVGPVVSADSNTGSLVAYQEGEPTAATDINYLIGRGGAPDDTATFLWKRSTEAGDTYRTHNAMTFPFRAHSVQTAAAMYANTAVYSSVFRRVLVLYFSAIDTITIWYRDIDGDFDSWVSTTATVADCDFWEGDAGFGSAEAADGRILISFNIQNQDTSTDVVMYESEDGGLTYTQTHRRILSNNTSGGFVATAAMGGLQLTSSGDWMRMTGLVSDSRATNNSLRTLVSPDRGSSWEIIESGGAASNYSLGTSYQDNWGHWPFDIVGVGDPAGTMMLVYALNGSTNRRVAFAQRNEDWVQDSSLVLDLDFGTNPKILKIMAARAHDLIWIYTFLEDDSTQTINLSVVDPENVRAATSWKNFGGVSFAGAMFLMPHLGRAVWAGHTMFLSGGANNPATGGTSDPLVAGHWMLTFGGWDRNSLQRTLRDRIPNYFRGTSVTADHSTHRIGWNSVMGTPDPASGDPNSLWTVVTTAAATASWNTDRQQVQATDATGTYYFQLDEGTPSNPSDAWGNIAGAQAHGTGHAFHFFVRVTENRQAPSAGEDAGFRIRPYASTAAAVADFSVRIGPTEITIYDHVATAQAGATITTTVCADWAEVRIAFRQVGGAGGGPHAVDIQARAWDGGANGDAWTVQETRTVTDGGAQTSQQIRAGILGAGGSGTTTMEWRDLAVGYRSALGQEWSQEAVPSDLVGYPASKFSILIADGIRARWAGSGAPQADAFTGEIDYTRGKGNLLFDSPRYLWESSDLVAQDLVFVANPITATPRWAMDTMLLVGTEDRTCTLMFANVAVGASFPATPAVQVELNADLFIDLTVIDVDGASVKLQAADGTLPQAGESVNMFLRFIGGPADGVTAKVYNDSRPGWFHATSGLDLAALGAQYGTTAVIYADRMVWRGSEFQQYSHFKIRFPDVSAAASSLGTPSGKHRLGSLVPGFRVPLDVPIDWTWRDNEQPNVTEQRARAGISWVNEEGPRQRIFEGRIVGDVERFRQKLRALLGKFHGYNVRPIGFVIDSKQKGEQFVVYGRWQAGSQKDEAAWYRVGEVTGAAPSTPGKWQTAGDADLVIVEEV